MICELCGRVAVHRHHVFGAANPKHSETYGLVASLCLHCHTGSNESVHLCRETDLVLKRRYQKYFEQQHPRESFIKVFGRSYQ